MSACVPISKQSKSNRSKTVSKSKNPVFATPNVKKPGNYQSVTNNVLSDGAPWQADFCRKSWKSGGIVCLVPFYLTDTVLVALASVPGNPPSVGSKIEADDFKTVQVLLGLQGSQVRKDEITRQNLPISESEPLTVMRFPIPGIRLDGSKAFTRRLFEMVQNDTFLAILEAKRKWNRARPYQRKNVVNKNKAMFFVEHSSYPSGHATEGFVILEVCRRLWSAKLKLNKNGSPVDAAYQEGFEKLECFAEDYALNREIAGVHYRSDTEAGRALAKSIMEKLYNINSFKSDIKRASLEWL